MNALKLFIVLGFALFFHQITAQSLLTDTLNVKYFAAFTAPDSNWNMPDYNDSNWAPLSGIKVFANGYGENPIFVQVGAAPSVYVRTLFNISSKRSLEEMVFKADFDDGFVAYINGTEFARVNMGDQLSPTTHTQLTERSHELDFGENYTVQGYYIGKDFIDKYVKEGENVLSFEVHNDSINGSDLAMYGYLLDMSNVDYNIYYPDCRYKRCVDLDSTKLPIVVIETDEFGVPYNKIDDNWEEVNAHLKIIDGANSYNKPSDLVNNYNGNISIQYRGESSSTFPKRSYGIETKDADWNDTSVSLIGMPRESDWVLQACFADKSQIRNALFYELARKTGNWTPRVEFCEVIFNGEYVGLYNLIEKIKRDSNRINIGKLRPEEISGTDLTGGYILRYDKGEDGVQIVYPKEDNLQNEQENYIRDFISAYESVLFSNNGLDENLGYKKYINEQSLLDYVIISELGKNCDSYFYSSYFYKNKDDRDPRITYGPIWDFDLCMGNAKWQEGNVNSGWQFAVPTNNKFNIERLFEDTELVTAFNTRWNELTQSYLHLDSLLNRIDELINLLEEPIARNYQVWPIIDKPLFFPAYSVDNYDEEISHIKSWLTTRYNWINSNIASIYYPVTQYTDVNQTPVSRQHLSANVYPNPVQHEMLIDLELPEAGELFIELINVQGRVANVIESTHVEQGSYKIYWNRNQQNIAQGLYLLNIKLNGKINDQIKVLMQ